MKVLGIRFCAVSPEAGELASFFRSLGMPERPLEEGDPTPEGEFYGAIFPAGSSWVEIWQEGEGMPAGVMLQVVVDDAGAFAEHAEQHGLEVEGPVDAHGERIYFVQGPSDLQVTIQSALG